MWFPGYGAPPAGADVTPGAGEADIVLDTQRVGSGHTVSVTLEGEDGKQVERTLLVDTGASYVSLPASLIPELGLAPEKLHTEQFQTANGAVDQAVGTLPAVWLNGQRIAGVAVAFSEDEQLGREGLLGMSILSRFRLTIDDENNLLVLAKL